MKTSNILLIIAGYMAIVAYILSLVNAFRHTPNEALTYIHAIGSFLFLLVSALFTFAELAGVKK